MRQARIFLFPSSSSAWPKTGVSKVCKSRKSSKVTAQLQIPNPPFNRLTFPFSFPRRIFPRHLEVATQWGGGREDISLTKQKLAKPIDWETLLSSFPPTYPDIPSQFLTVNQPSSTSSTVFPEVVWRRNKSCRFTKRGGGKEREKNNRRQTIQREAFVRDNNHPFCSPSHPGWNGSSRRRKQP